MIITCVINRLFAVESAWAFNLVVEQGLVENTEVAAFVALERNMAEYRACGHVFAIAHGAFAGGVKVVVILPIEYNVQSDISDREPATFRKDVFVMSVVIVHYHEFCIAILVEMESVLVVPATATPVKEPSVTAGGGDSRVLKGGFGGFQLLRDFKVLR